MLSLIFPGSIAIKCHVEKRKLSTGGTFAAFCSGISFRAFAFVFESSIAAVMDIRNYSFTTDDPKKGTSLSKKIVWVCLLLLFGGFVGALSSWLVSKRIYSFRDGGCGLDPEPFCSAIPDSRKFDCHPDRPISEKECLQRGCCYQPASDLDVSDSDLIHSSYLGVPSCFYPSNYKGYEIGEIIMKDNYIATNLTRKKPSGFPDDVVNVNLLVDFINENSLRIKITDLDSSRFEPDIDLNELPAKQGEELYNVDLNAAGILAVNRKSTGAIMFKTDLSYLIFSNQFLQLSSYTSSQYLYGLGEHKEGFLKSFNWTRLTLFNQGDIPVPNRNLYGSHPFCILMEPGGNANGIFLLNSNAMDVILQPAPAATFRPIGGVFDFYIFLGPTPADVVHQYTSLVGHTFMPPYWSLGFHICKYGYFSLNKTIEVFQRNIDENIPIDVQWHDIDFMDRHLDFTYDPDNFAGLPEFVDELHRNGRRYVAMISPGVSNSEEPDSYAPYDDGAKLDLFIKDINGKYIEGKVWNTNMTVFPDYSNPATPSYWAKQFKGYYSKLQFDGIWIDMNEPLNFHNGTIDGCPKSPLEDPPYLPGRPYPLRTLTLCMTAKHHNTTHYNEHNLLAYQEAKATYEAIKEIRQKRPFIISRASFSGQGIHSGHWSGDINSDWEDMRYTIPSMLMFNLYGMSMIGSDICGFRGNTTEELCTRWQLLGAFYPFSRNHNDFDTIEQDPAAMGPTVVAATKYSLNIRYYLLPYLYTLFYRSHIYGDTVIRPLFFEFPNDKETYDINEEFLWGPAVLIVPVLYPNEDKVKAYFPKGVWYDFLTGESKRSRGERFTLETNLTAINVAVRNGYVLPLQIPGKTALLSRSNNFDLLVALEDNTASGELYWDDGDSLATFESGSYNLIKFSVENNIFKNAVAKRGFDTKMDVNVIKVYGLVVSPLNVTINGQTASYEFTENILSLQGRGLSLLTEFEVAWY